MEWILKHLVLIIIAIIVLVMIIAGILMMRKKHDSRDNDEDLEFIDLWDDD